MGPSADVNAGTVQRIEKLGIHFHHGLKAPIRDLMKHSPENQAYLGTMSQCLNFTRWSLQAGAKPLAISKNGVVRNEFPFLIACTILTPFW